MQTSHLLGRHSLVRQLYCRTREFGWQYDYHPNTRWQYNCHPNIDMPQRYLRIMLPPSWLLLRPQATDRMELLMS